MFAASVLCVLSIAGCKGRLSKTEASKIISDRVKQIDTSPVGASVDIGEEKEYFTPGKACDVNEPFGMREDRPYIAAGVIVFTAVGPCDWKFSLAPEYAGDLAQGDRVPSVGATYLTLNLARFSGMEIRSVKQDGPHATVDSVAHFAFTDTAKATAKVGHFEKLEPPCAYDLPTHEVRCDLKMPFALVDGRWQIDVSNAVVK